MSGYGVALLVRQGPLGREERLVSTQVCRRASVAIGVKLVIASALELVSRLSPPGSLLQTYSVVGLCCEGRNLEDPDLNKEVRSPFCPFFSAITVFWRLMGLICSFV